MALHLDSPPGRGIESKERLVSLAQRLTLLCAALVLPLGAHATVRMQFAHAAPLATEPDGTAVTLRINGQDVIPNFRFGDQRGYADLGGSGNYTIQIVRSGVVLVNANTTLVDGTLYSGIVLGNNTSRPLGLLITQDIGQAPAPGQAIVRAIHVGAFTPAEDVAVRRTNGAVFAGIAQLAYAVPGNYAQIPAETASLRVTSVDGGRALSGDANITLAAGSTTTLLVAGDNEHLAVRLMTMPGGTAPVGNVDHSVTGAWTTGNATGQGLTLMAVPAERRLIGTWYTYPPAGGAREWYTLDSCRTPVGQGGCAFPNAFDNRRAVLAIYAPSGGRFLTSDPITLRIAGTLTIDFQSCTQATATYELDGRSGSFAMQNLVTPPNCTIP